MRVSAVLCHLYIKELHLTVLQNKCVKVFNMPFWQFNSYSQIISLPRINSPYAVKWV